MQKNVIFSSDLFEACVRNKVQKIVFISSGGTVYGKEINCPLTEDTQTNPISSYGVCPPKKASKFVCSFNEDTTYVTFEKPSFFIDIYILN